MTIRPHRALAAALPALLATGLAAFPSAAHAASATTSEVAVLPVDDAAAPVQPTQDFVVLAGSTGFLHRRSNTTVTPYLWTSFADRSTRVVTELDGKYIQSAGGDEVAVTGPYPGPAPDDVPVIDLGTGKTRELKRGGYAGLFYVYGNRMLAFKASDSSGVPELRTYAADGTWTTTPIVDPSGTVTHLSIRTGDAVGVVVIATVTDGTTSSNHFGLLDLASGHLAPMANPVATVGRIVLSDDRIVVADEDNTTVRAYSRADITAGTSTAPTATYTVPAARAASLALVGDKLLAAPSNGADSLRSYSPGNATGTVVMAATGGIRPVIQEPGGTALVVAGSTTSDLAVRRLTTTGSSVFLPLVSAKMVTAGLTLTHGILRRVEGAPLLGEPPQTYQVATSAVAPGASAPVLKYLPGPVLPCDGACPHTVGDDNGAVSIQDLPDNRPYSVRVHDDQAGTILDGTSGTVVDAGYGWAVVDTTGPFDPPTKQYVLRLGTDPALTRPVGAAAISLATLWTAPKAGTLQPQELLDASLGALGAPIVTGSNCTATEIQATSRYLYWTCGASGPAGVYDLTTAKNVTVPAADYELGDGYLVHHEANGDLVRNTITGGTFGASAKLANFAKGTGDERNISWTVDKFGGDVAWVDANSATHVVDPAVPASPVAVGALTKPNGDVLEVGPGWNATAYLTRPVASWKATFTQASTGKVAYTATGGPAAGTIPFSWDGLVDGKKAPSGRYTYALSVTAGGATTTIASSTLLLNCGSQNWHSYQCDGASTIMGITPSGEGHWLLTNPGTGVSDPGKTETWHANLLVPFADVNSDGKNDLLVRGSDGSLKMLLGHWDTTNFTGATEISYNSGWNSYDTMVSPGDINGDGYNDLLMRLASTGVIYIYPGQGNGHFGAAYTLPGTYKAYNRIVGTGDISGDGIPDLALFTPAGIMYQMWGDGHGGFTAPTGIGSGWTKYNTVVGIGDLNQDGHNDLLLRDTTGVIYRMTGTGGGNFNPAQVIGNGYQKYYGLY